MSTFSTLVEVLQLRASESPDKTACTFLPDHGGEESLTYRELDRRARAVAAVLSESGLSESGLSKNGAMGERAFLFYPPGLDYLVAFLGCLYAGVVAIPAYPPDPMRLDRTLPRLLTIMHNAQPRRVLTTAAIRMLAAGMLQNAPELAALDWLATDTVEPDAADRYREPAWDPHMLAFLQYTSGSTGHPKGVMLDHGNLLSNLAMIQRNFGMRRDDKVASWLPPYHDMGLIGTILQPLYVGGQAILLSPMGFLRKPRSWLQAITKYRANVTGGPNFGYELCVRKIPKDQRAELDLSTLEVAFVGAEPIRARTLEAFAEAFAPCGFRRTAYLPCYGLAEATLLASGAAGEDSGLRGGGFRTLGVDKAAYERGRVEPSDKLPAKPAGVLHLTGSGHVSPALDLQIVDPETHKPCAPGEVGEIWIAGPSVARGYWEREDDTRATFGVRLADGSRGGFLRSGDLGFLRGAELYVCGRRKELIIIRGRNLHPSDIETVVESSHGQLRPGCCAAFSVEQDDEERLIVVVEVATPQISAAVNQEIHGAVLEGVALAHGLRVDDLVLLPPGTILKTSSGKLQRRACRAAFLEGALPRVAIAGLPAGATAVAV